MFSVRVLHESTVQNKLFALVDAMANAALDPVQARSLLGLRIEAEVCMPDSVEFTAESFHRYITFLLPTFAKGIQPRSSLQRFLYGDSDGIVKLDVRLAEYVLCSLCTDLDFNA